MTKIIRLPNGVTVVNEYRPSSGQVAMHLFIKSGSGHESDAENGLTNLVQEATQGGTKTRTHDEIFNVLQAAGGGLSSTTSASGTTFWTEVLAPKAEGAFEVIADVLRNPAFDSGEIQKTRNMLKRFMRAAEQSPGTILRKLFGKQVFGDGQAVSNPPDGTAEKVDGFTDAQVKAKYAELLSNPSNIFISFAGNMDDATAEKLAAKYFGDIPASGKAANANPPAKFTGGDARVEQENEQTHFSFGFEGPNKNDSDKYAVILMKEIVAGGMSAPLFQEIREKRGLVYTVGASYSPTDESGLFAIGGGAGKGNIGELIAVTFDLLGNTMREGFDQKDLDQAVERIMRRTVNARETPDDAAQANLGNVIEKGRIVQPAELEFALKQVKPEDLQRVLYNMLSSDNYALTTVGPQDTMPTPQEIKDMMKAAVDGFTPPVKQPVAALSAAFAGAAAKEDVAEIPAQVTVLPNGIKVITQTKPGNLSAGAWVGAGSDHESENINGSTHMLEHMVFKGTPRWPAGSIDAFVEGELGGGLNAYTTRDKTAYYYFNLKPDALDKIIEISGEMVFFPILDHEEFDGKTVVQKDGTSVKNKGERDVVIEELRRANDEVGSRKWDILYSQAYPDQPHGWTILGPEKTLRQMTVEDLKTFHDEHYAPNNVIFSVVGPVKHEDVVKLVEAKFGNLKPAVTPDLPTPEYRGGTAYEEYNKAKLANISIAAEGVSETDPDGAAYELLGAILGGGQTSRLYKEIVTDKELSASIGAGMQSYRNSGTFSISTGVEAKDVKTVMNLVYKNLREVASSIDPEELVRVKAATQMSILSAFGSNDSAVNVQAVQLQAFGKLVTPAEMAATYEKVTAEDIKRVAKKILAQNPTAVGIVPPGTDKALLPTHAEVVAMRDGTWQPAAANTNKPKPPAAVA